MFTVEDFFKILNFLKGETISDSELDPNIKINAESDRGITKNYFEKILDQLSYSSLDYLRLRKFYIDWYSSHKTILTTAKHANDVFSLPDKHVDELIRSYGFDLPAQVLQYFTNKRNFFLDLVNLYKIKGTPDSIIKVLTYYGFKEIDIGEYWLRKNDNGELIFRGDYTTGTGSIILDKWSDDLSYNQLTSRDPHWFLNYDQAMDMINRSKLGLPSKSPYFSLRPQYDLGTIDEYFSIVIWQLHQDYNKWKNGKPLIKNIKVRGLNYMVSYLELYTAMVYSFNETFMREHGSSDQNIICYDGTATTYAEIRADYKKIVTNPANRAERESNLRKYFQTFTKDRSTHPFEYAGDAKTILSQLNQDLKNRIDSYISTGRGIEPLGYLMREFDYWVQNNVSSGAPFLSLIVLGMESQLIKDIKELINFFKPYRARMSTVEIMYITRNPLLDSIRVDDSLLEKINMIWYDYINWGKPCCTYPDKYCPEAIVESYYNRNTYDCGSYYDIGAAFDKKDCFIQIKDEIDDYRLVCRKGWDTTTWDFGYELDSTSSDITYVWVDGGFSDFDESGVYDCITTAENVQITVQEIT